LKTTKNPSRLTGSLIAAAVLIVDQVTKLWIYTSIPEHTRIEILPSFFFTHTYNKGIAFGLFPQFSWLYIIIALGFVVYVSSYWSTFNKGTRYALAFLAGGASGNLIDRITHGAVLDWIGIQWFSVFNVADIAITLSVVGLIIYEIYKNNVEKNNTKQPKAPPK